MAIGTRIQNLRGLAARWTSVNPILLQGEQGLELDTSNSKWGDGVTAWNDLPYALNTTYAALAGGTSGSPQELTGYSDFVNTPTVSGVPIATLNDLLVYAVALGA